jgi:hypothetical protein
MESTNLNIRIDKDIKMQAEKLQTENSAWKIKKILNYSGHIRYYYNNIS